MRTRLKTQDVVGLASCYQATGMLHDLNICGFAGLRK